MLFLRKLTGIVCLFFLVFQGCSDDDNPVAPNSFEGLIKISEAYTASAGMKIQIWAEDELIAGYNKLYIAVIDSATGNFVTDAHINLEPIMDMGTMQHSTPVENPESIANEDKLFPCGAVFIMSSMGGNWTINVKVHNHNTNLEGVAAIPVIVSDVTPPVVKSIVTLDDGSKLFVSYLRPTKLQVGINDIEITIHRRDTMMEFPADSGYSVILTPEMPSMGHGSPNNVNPVHSQNGHFKGKVNFTMTGDWRLNLDLYKNGIAADTTLFFDVIF
jgi:hypothetical protein